MVAVKILGVGCPKCHALETRVRKVANQHDLDLEIIKVADIGEMLRYNIMMTPALVIQEEVKSIGIMPKEGEILEWLTL
jgi:small redox-active disulfide protein 2